MRIDHSAAQRLPQRVETQQRFEQEEQSYWRQRDELMKQYAGKWVAIVGGQVAAVGEQMNKVAAAVGGRGVINDDKRNN